MTFIGKAFMIATIVLAILLSVSGITIWSYKKEIKELTRDYLVKTTNEETCKIALSQQNEEIEKLRIEYDERKQQVKIITKEKIVEKLKIVYKDRNVTKEECNNVESVIDAIRTNGF